MKKVLLVFLIFIVVVAALFFLQNYLKEGGKLSFFGKSTTVTIGEHKFKVNVANSQDKREVGLSKTPKLSDDSGMIFVFEKPNYYSFWMKNMKFAIDIIYINDDSITTIENNVQPPNDNGNLTIFYPQEPSDKVLEINGGLSEKYNFKKGDKVKIENL